MYKIDIPSTHMHSIDKMEDKELSEDLEQEGQKKFWRAAWGFDCLPCIPARYTLAMVSCLGFINVYALRVNLSVAIVQMDNSTATLRNNSAMVGSHAILG